MQRFKKAFFTFYRSVWFFPAILFIFVIILSVLQINGSSIGMYHQIFYGNTIEDPNLIVNKPRGIRSDEWLVTTQLSIAQTKTDFASINPNVGNGEDVSLLVDAPTADFSQIFKPHNLGYFFLSTGAAFALKWWLLAYFLIISVYFFILTIAPKKKSLAIITSLAFTMSPFIAWWYQYITLAPIYYALFMSAVVIKMIHLKSVRKSLLWGLLLAYLTTSFAVVLYPPFQIPCALVMLSFLIGYYLDHRHKTWKDNKPLVVGGGLAIVTTAILVALCFIPKLPIIETIANTAYPGQRTVPSGGMNPGLFIASNVSILTQSDSRVQNYEWIGNQSGGSNFLLVFILLLPALVYLAIKYRRKLDNFYSILCILVVSSIFLAWMFVPEIDWLGKITFLDRVPQVRLFIGFGLINLLIFILFIQIYNNKSIKLPKYFSLIYSLTVCILYVTIDIYICNLFPSFMSLRWAMILSLPYPLINYLILKRQMLFAISTFIVFSIASVMFVHPLYKGVDTITNSELSQAMQKVDPNGTKKWVSDSLVLENIPVVNGKKSLSGVYVYPQNEIWRDEFGKNNEYMYNRYAHVRFEFDRDKQTMVKPLLSQPQADVLVSSIEPCDIFLKDNGVGYIMTTTPFNSENATCTTLRETVTLPQMTVYLYSLKF